MTARCEDCAGMLATVVVGDGTSCDGHRFEAVSAPWTPGELGARAADAAWQREGFDAPRKPGRVDWIRIGMIVGRVLDTTDRESFVAGYRETLHARFMGG